MAKPIVDIVFVRYNCKNIEDEALSSLIHNTVTNRVTYRVIDYDNYDIKSKKSKHSLTKLWNTFIERSEQEYICLLNSDIKIVDGKWLEKLIKGIISDPLIAVIGPSTNNCKNATQIQTEKIKHSKFVLKYVDEVMGFCFMLRKSIWKLLGGFNEDFSFYGAETEYTYRVKKQKYKVAYCQNAFVFHYGEYSIREAEKRKELMVKTEREKGRCLFSKIVG